MQEYIIFNMFNESYAIELKKVKEILIYENIIITQLFNEDDYVLGVTNLRGEVVPIVDLRIRFGEKKPAYLRECVVAIVKTKKKKLVGVVVDFIKSIQSLDNDLISKVISHHHIHIEEKYTKGFVKIEDEMLIILNIDKILN